MKIIMYVPGMEFDGMTIKQGKSLGGSETSGYFMARELARAGHLVFVFCNTPEGKTSHVDGVNYIHPGAQQQQAPFGEAFHSFAENIPHDVLLAQRIPAFFHRKYASKINLWWTHDLALKRFMPQISGQMWNVDRVLAVSEWHKQQIASVYDMQPSIIEVLPNGIDQSLFERRRNSNAKLSSKLMVYSSRPERGLIHLVREGGIMEQLYKIDPAIQLAVCGYDNTTPEMAELYHYLWRRCEELPNVKNYGHLGKEHLISLMQSAWLHVYPTDFEETSCITAMEEQACGTPFVTTRTGALEETLQDGGVLFVEKQDTGTVNCEKFVEAILTLSRDPSQWIALHDKALVKSKSYDYRHACQRLLATIDAVFAQKTDNAERVMTHLIRNSEIMPALQYAEGKPELGSYVDQIHQDFDYVWNGGNDQHYDEAAQYHMGIRNDHALGLDDVHLQMPRMQHTVHLLSQLPKGAKVLDYGCCVGQFTIAAARAFPHLEFVGVDISKNQIAIAHEYREENKIWNASFLADTDMTGWKPNTFDMIIFAEILEHLPEPCKLIEQAETILKPQGIISITTPYGAFDAHKPWGSFEGKRTLKKEHLWNFAESDLLELFGKKKDFQMFFTAQPKSECGAVMGNYCYSWTVDKKQPRMGAINYQRKLHQLNPEQTLAVCMIVRPDGDSLGKTLRSVADIAHEIIVGISGDIQSGNALKIAHEFGATILHIPPPTEIGFDEARNITISRASADWILWIDDDETLQWPNRLIKYLRNNQYDSYAIHQHHYTAEPPSLLKTDLPCRLFRNRKNIRFFGVVHEHPEVEINQGAGKTFLIPPNETAIMHMGYETEEVRRKRFMRNWPLMARDHLKYPQRTLGKMLYLRDLAHLNRFEFMQSQRVSPEMVQRAQEALGIWRELIREKNVRMVVDAMDYMSECTDIVTQGRGIVFEVGLAVNQNGIGDPINDTPVGHIRGKFEKREDIEALLHCLMADKLSMLEGKYL